MADAGGRLSVDYWHTTVSAALRTPSGGVAAVAVDGETVSPAGVAVDENGELCPGRRGTAVAAREPQRYVRMPGSRLLDDRITVGSVLVDPIDLVAATLRPVAREAARVAGAAPQQVVISVPAGWVRRQRTAMLEAARRANLHQPQIVTGAESIVREQAARGATIPAGSVVVVCRLDATVGELVVLRPDADRFIVEASPPLGELGETAGSTLVEQAVTALSEVLDPAWPVSAVYWQGPAAMASALSAALSQAGGPSVTPVHVADVAAAFGGIRSVPNSPETKPRSRPAWGRIAHSALAAIFAWSAAAVLVYQMLNSGVVYPPTSTSGQLLATEWYVWCLIPVLAILGATALSLLIVDLSRRHRSPRGPDPALGSGLVLSAVIGAGFAGVLALIASVYFKVAPPPLLRWTLWSALPLSLIVGAVGAVTARFDASAAVRDAKTALAWRDRVRFPLVAIVLATVSTVTLVASHVAVPRVDASWWWTMEHLGAFGITWAIACMFATDPWRRVIVGSLLSAPSIYAISIDTAGIIVVCLIIAIVVWWLLRFAPLVSVMRARMATAE